jgi:glycerophosphoryl diester phosphodiesterase
MLRKFDLQGHRGARALFPENTIEGFVGTLGIGVDTIELDIALTADGVAVVTHDARLNPDLTRGPDGAWLTRLGPPVRKLTFSELRRYDVGRPRPGSAYALLFPDQAPCDGAHIPTLTDVLALTLPAGVRVEAELKTLGRLTASPVEAADAVVAAATEAGALHLLGVRSFDWRGLRYLRRHRPEIPLTWLTRDATVAIEARGSRNPIWAPAHPRLTEARVAEAHALGIAVIPWTVNAPEDMARLIGWGVDGLCSDRPDLVRVAMLAAGMTPPRAVSFSGSAA